MVKILVSMSMPIVHHVTIPCLESLLVSSSEGTVATKVPCLATLGTFLLLLGVILDLPTGFNSLGIFFPVHVSALFEMRDYLPYGCLLPSPPWDMVPHLLCNPVISICAFQCLLPLHKFDVLESPLGVEVGNFLDCKNFLFLPVTVGMEGSQQGLIS